MKRSGLITALAIIQALIGVGSLSLAFFILALSRSREVMTDPDAAGEIHNLRMAFLSLLVFAAPTLISFVGLWRLKRWGRWLAMVLNAITVGALLYAPLADGEWPDGADISMIIIFGTLLLLFALPVVGKQFKISHRHPAAGAQL